MDEDLDRRDQERHGNEEPPPIPEEGSHRYRWETLKRTLVRPDRLMQGHLPEQVELVERLAGP
ncbi:MAG TPA: hypothetical protein VII77_09525, partial [Candidatus Deferrimicrobium sp.]